MTDISLSELRENQIVQLNPETCGNKMLAGCFMVITEVKSWGAQGYVQCTGENGEMGGQAYYRAKFDEMVATSSVAPFVIGEETKP